MMKMNRKKITNSIQPRLMAVVFIAASLVTAMMIGINNSQNLQKAMAEDDYPPETSITTETANEYKTASANSSSSSMTGAAVKCDTCPQNTPLHPAEQPPVNSTIPTGGGFKMTEPNKAGAWDFRSFTFSPSQIVVNQGDKVTLHFIGVQGAHHVVTVDGIGTFELKRGQINTVSFVANNPGIINYVCHVHLPNMVGQILVLPKASV